jgi:hypothetical protein
MLSSTYTPLSLLFQNLKTFNRSMYTSFFNLTLKNGPKHMVQYSNKMQKQSLSEQ